jgi:hypothetical protein
MTPVYSSAWDQFNRGDGISAHTFGNFILAVLILALLLWISYRVLESERAENPIHFALRVVLRVIWRNIRLLFKTIFAVLCIIAGFGLLFNCASPSPVLPTTTTGGGPQGEKLAAFENSILWLPSQVWYAFIGILQILSFIILVFVAGAMEWVALNLALIGIVIVIAYAIWSIYTVNDVIKLENKMRETSSVDREQRRQRLDEESQCDIIWRFHENFNLP